MRGKKNTATESAKVSTRASGKVKQDNTAGKWLFLMIVLLGAFVGFQQKEIYDLRKNSETFKNDLQQANEVLKNDLQQANEALKSGLQQNIDQNIAQMKKVYIYNLEETLRGVNLEALNQEFERKLNVLNEEVTIAKQKISSLKNTKEKDNFSDIYLKSLKLKRDTMIQEYNHTLEDLTEQINQIVSEIAQERNALVILDARAVASLTDNVEDVTGEVIKRVKVNRPKSMDQ